MINRIVFTVLIALLALTACDTEPAPPDLEGDSWCYIYSFGGAAENSAGVPMTISTGQVGTGGLETVGGQLNLSFTENFYFRPEWIYIRLQRAELASSFNVSVSGSVFGVNIARSETIPADLETIHAQYDNPNPNSLEGNSVNVSITSGAKLVVEFVQIYGTGHNPYPRDDCAPITPEATPTPEITNTPTGGPTPEPCNTVIWDFEGTPQGWELIRNPSWSNSLWSPHLAQDFVHVPTGGVGGGYIGDGNQHGTSTVKRGIGAGIYDLNLAGSCNVESMQIYWRSNGSSSASVRMRLLVDGTWFDPTVPGNWFGFNGTGGTVAWRTYDFESRGYQIPLNAIDAIEFGSYEWYETQIFEVRINPQGPSGPTATPTASPSATIDPTIAAINSACVGTTQPTERSVTLWNWGETLWQTVDNDSRIPPDGGLTYGYSLGYFGNDIWGIYNGHFPTSAPTLRGMNHEFMLNPPYNSSSYSVVRVAVQYQYTKGHDVTATDSPRMGVRSATTNAVTWGEYQTREGTGLVTYMDFDTPTSINGVLFQGVTDRRIDSVSPDGFLGLYKYVFCIRESPPTTPTPSMTPMQFPTLTATVTPFVLPTVTIPPTAIQWITPTPYPTITPAPSRTSTPPPTITPPPPTPLPSVTPGPTNTPRATSTLISLPSPVGTEVGGTPIPGPQLTPIPGTPSFGTPEQIGTPNATWVGTPVYEATYLPTPDNLDEWHDQAESQLGTAVAYMNELPTEWNSLMPDIGNVGAFAGYAKYAMSGVNLQEIFGVTVYPIVQHSLYGFVVVLIVASARMIWRLVLVAFKFAAWIVRWILKIIPFIG